MFRRLLQETYELLDLQFYDVASSTNINNYTANSGESITYDSTEQAYKITKTGYEGLSSVTLNNNRFSNTVSIKADIKMGGSSTNHQVGIGLLNGNVGVDGKFTYYSPDNYYGVAFIESTRTSYGRNEVSQITSFNIQKNVWYTLIVEINGNNQTLHLYDGDTLVGTVSANKSVLSADNNELAIWNGFFANSTTFIKNIQVKAL